MDGTQKGSQSSRSPAITSGGHVTETVHMVTKQAALKKLLPYCPVPTILTSVSCRNTIIKLNARSFNSLLPK